MSKITQGNIVKKLLSAAHNANTRGFNPDLYEAAALEIEGLRESALADAARVRELEARVQRLEGNDSIVAFIDRTDKHIQLEADRDRLVAQVERHIDAFKSAHYRADNAEAEVTRLTARWEAMRRYTRVMGYESGSVVEAKMNQLEAQR